MTQLVYVHGVSVRNEPGDQDYEESVARRRKAFQEMGFGGGAVSFYDPYWGEHGAPKEYQSIELDGDIWLALGALEDFTGIATPLASGDLASTTLRDAAEDDFAATVNSLSIILADPRNPAGDPELALHLADYLVAFEDAEGVGTKPSWMNASKLADDEDFLAWLELAARPEDIPALNIGEALKKSGKWLIGKGIGLVGDPASRLARRLTPAVAMFFGDAFIYLKRCGDGDDRRDKIQSAIGRDLVEAAKNSQADDDKLIVVGHSMGANILYDMLTDAALVQELENQIAGKLEIDLFLTVGTQMGLLQELGLFGNGSSTRPKPCKRWWHVFNMMDVLSFGASRVFTGVEQFQANTNASIIDAHNAYFTSPVFQRRLYKRLKADGLAE